MLKPMIVYRIQVIPISQAPLSVSVTAKTHSGLIYLYVGPWTQIRAFLSVHLASGFTFSEIDGEVDANLTSTLEIIASEQLLIWADFEAVSALRPGLPVQ